MGRPGVRGAKSGTPLEAIIAQEGTYTCNSYTNIVHTRRNREAALAYINQLLFDQGMLSLPKALQYGPKTDVALGELAADILINCRELRESVKIPGASGDGPRLGRFLAEG